MALTAQEIDKVNDVYKQLDTAQADIKWLKENIETRLDAIEKKLNSTSKKTPTKE